MRVCALEQCTGEITFTEYIAANPCDEAGCPMGTTFSDYPTDYSLSVPAGTYTIYSQLEGGVRLYYDYKSYCLTNSTDVIDSSICMDQYRNPDGSFDNFPLTVEPGQTYTKITPMKLVEPSLYPREWSTYSGAGFTIQYPSSWSFHSCESNCIISFTKTYNPKSRPWLTIYQKNFSQPTLEEYLDSCKLAGETVTDFFFKLPKIRLENLSG